MNNKLIFVVFSILLILVGNSAAAESTLRIENGTSKANDTITVNITALNVSDLSNFDLNLSYDPSIVNVTNANNNLAFGATLNNLEKASNGTIRLITLNTGLGQSGDVLLSTLTLRAIGSPGLKSYLNLTVNTFVNSVETDIPIGVENGTFNISGSTLKSIIISPSATTTLTVGGSQLFSATAVDQNDNPITGIEVSWTVSNFTVGSVIPTNGIIEVTGGATTMFTALAPGSAMVNATNGSFTATATVTVEQVPPFLNLIDVLPTTKTLFVGKNFTFTAYPKDQYGDAFTATVTWSSSNTTVGTVDTSGKFIAANPGTAMVNATNGSFTGTAIVTVENVPPFLNLIDVLPTTKTLFVGNNFTFTAYPKDQYGDAFTASVTWSSSNQTVGTVNTSGKFIASNPGTAMVNATNGSFTGTAIVTIEKIPSSITFIPPTDPNNTILTTRNWTFINVSLSESGSAWLEWNGFNESMSGAGSFWYINKTGLGNGTYTYRVWANDSAGNENVSETRVIEILFPSLKGDLNGNGISADAGDLVLMKRASIIEITADSRYDLNNNGQNADAGDLVLMKRASIGEIKL